VVLSGSSSTTKTGCHDIAEILLKVALNTKNQSINQIRCEFFTKIDVLFYPCEEETFLICFANLHKMLNFVKTYSIFCFIS
jgi:hypothetical protein